MPTPFCFQCNQKLGLYPKEGVLSQLGGGMLKCVCRVLRMPQLEVARKAGIDLPVPGTAALALCLCVPSFLPSQVSPQLSPRHGDFGSIRRAVCYGLSD